MAFVSISINDYIKKHIENNPTEDKKDLRTRIDSTLEDYKNGVKCSCGNDIWVIGSASVGNMCFTCITGEAYPKDDFEIEQAVKKKDDISGRRHINDIDPTKIAGFFDDDGYEINMDLIKKPSLCLTCIKDDNPHEEFLCKMNRHGQKDDEGFICHAFEKNK